MSFLFDKAKAALDEAGKSIKTAVQQTTAHTHSHVHRSGECSDGDSHHLHRFQSFAPQREGNDAKWYVDGAGYMHAVSVALEQAEHEVWIMDWWLSPELYLRRPPAKNEQYRLDKMLFAAAKRGVQINVMVYKEVTQALTLSSWHTKHWLEDEDKTGNIRVFRHPDHTPDKQTLASSFWSSIKEGGMSAARLSQLPGDALKGIYGMSEDVVLYWAHHEKLCLVDGKIAFMGGLDLCYGRWDTNQHAIADAHPGDLDRIVFPGQDYNNARIMDFQDVQNWQNNKLDRKYNSRMGWSDVSICLKGPVVQDLRAHFAQRWNYIYYEKYDVRKDARYHPIDYRPSRVGIVGHPYTQVSPGAEVDGEGQYGHFRDKMRKQYEDSRARLSEKVHRKHHGDPEYASGPLGGVEVQLMRSCDEWSHGVAVEHSIANAYIATIHDSVHFVYIENQFFITATSPEQNPIQNKIGAAIVERIVRAARNGEDYQMIINIPSVPAFAGDLKADESLGTRAIMEFQYNSINRGGHSIMEKIAAAGIDPTDYLRFYNLRNYDRINISKAMSKIEEQAGVDYNDARRGYDQQYGQTLGPEAYGDDGNAKDAYNRFQQAAQDVHGQDEDLASGRWDTVAECYMLNGTDIREVPWNGDAQSEMDAFVSEELYIHSKLLIADDRKVIVGSANLNDRSQLGSHDSEIAVLIEDPTEISSFMAGRPWKANLFAASLRRHIFRKHLGLLPVQDIDKPDINFFPIGSTSETPWNAYDWNSREDHAVADPLSPSFTKLWQDTAATNTAAFARVFHPVPSDEVRNWKEYDAYYSRFFGKAEEAKAKGAKGVDAARPSTWKWGLVVAEEFIRSSRNKVSSVSGAEAGGSGSEEIVGTVEDGVREVKEVLSRVRGNLVEMPLLFLREEDIAKEGLGLNAWTEEVYT